jgi:type VII secretion-associated serine protease mycosin
MKLRLLATITIAATSLATATSANGGLYYATSAKSGAYYATSAKSGAYQAASAKGGAQAASAKGGDHAASANGGVYYAASAKGGAYQALIAREASARVVLANGAARACGPVITDPLAEAPWALTRLRPELAWPLSTGTGVTVAVIDSGVSSDHPALAGKVLPGIDLVVPGEGSCDENGHGTLIAGIIAGRETISNGFRFQGIAPGATIVPVRVLRDQQRTFEEGISARIASAIRWAIDVGGARVLNMSLTTLPSPELAEAVQYGLSRGAVIVAAAGNQGSSGDPAYPAAYDGVIAVAGTGPDDVQAGTSTVGSYVDVAAPGTRIAGPSPAGQGFLFSEAGGTSFATAYVSGVAALIRSYDPSLSPQQIRERIVTTADHPAELWNPAVGYGIVNPQRAVGALRPGKVPAVAVPGQFDAPPRKGDPLRGVTVIAGWATLAGAVTVALILIVVPALKRGRKRGWRPSRVDNRTDG